MIEDDLPIFFEHQRDPAANRMAAFPARDREAFMEHWTTRVLGDDTATKRTIVVDEQVVGNIVSWMSDERLVGYWIGREHWGKGIASRALALFVADVETRRPLHAHVARHNPASIRVLEKAGFGSSVKRPSRSPEPRSKSSSCGSIDVTTAERVSFGPTR